MFKNKFLFTAFVGLFSTLLFLTLSIKISYASAEISVTPSEVAPGSEITVRWSGVDTRELHIVNFLLNGVGDGAAYKTKQGFITGILYLDESCSNFWWDVTERLESGSCTIELNQNIPKGNYRIVLKKDSGFVTPIITSTNLVVRDQADSVLLCNAKVNIETPNNGNNPTSWTSGQNVSFQGWKRFCSSPLGKDADGRVDLWLCNSNNLASCITKVASGQIFNRTWDQDAIEANTGCGAGPRPNNYGWRASFAVPRNLTAGSYYLNAIAVAESATVDCRTLASTRITVVAPTPAPTQAPTPTLTISPSQISPGQATTVSWSNIPSSSRNDVISTWSIRDNGYSFNFYPASCEQSVNPPSSIPPSSGSCPSVFKTSSNAIPGTYELRYFHGQDILARATLVISNSTTVPSPSPAPTEAPEYTTKYQVAYDDPPANWDNVPEQNYINSVKVSHTFSSTPGDKFIFVRFKTNKGNYSRVYQMKVVLSPPAAAAPVPTSTSAPAWSVNLLDAGMQNAQLFDSPGSTQKIQWFTSTGQYYTLSGAVTTNRGAAVTGFPAAAVLIVDEYPASSNSIVRQYNATTSQQFFGIAAGHRFAVILRAVNTTGTFSNVSLKSSPDNPPTSYSQNLLSSDMQNAVVVQNPGEQQKVQVITPAVKTTYKFSGTATNSGPAVAGFYNGSFIIADEYQADGTTFITQHQAGQTFEVDAGHKLKVILRVINTRATFANVSLQKLE